MSTVTTVVLTNPSSQSQNVTDIQAAHDAAGIGGTVIYPPGVYDINDVIKFYSGQTIFGQSTHGTIIWQHNNTKPALASGNYYDIGTYDLVGGVRIRNLTIKGAYENSGNHGILLRDFDSIIEDVRIEGAGGNGIHMTHLDSNQAAPTGNLINNFFINVVCEQIEGHSFYLGAISNGKLTDGALINCKGRSLGYNDKAVVYIGAGAGWFLEGIHTYGDNRDFAIEIYNGMNTRLNDIYIETFKYAGIKMFQMERQVTISNVTSFMNAAASGGRAFDFTQAIFENDVPAKPRVLINNVSLYQTVSTPTFGIQTNAQHILVDTDNFVEEGAGRGNITRSNMPSGLFSLSKPPMGNAVEFAGDSVMEVTIPIPKLRSYSKVLGQIYIGASQNHGATSRIAYFGMVLVTAKDNASDAWSAVLTDLTCSGLQTITPTGSYVTGSTGTVNVWAQIDSTGPGGFLNIKFRAANNDAYGAMSFYYMPSEQ